MGYTVEMDLKDLLVPASKVQPCLGSINGLHSEEALLRQAEIVDMAARHARAPIRRAYGYGHVPNPPNSGFSTLVETLEAWGYRAVGFPDGSVVVTEYTGDKWEYDELLYQTIAPYLFDGGEILVRGEDGAGTTAVKRG